jgi:glycosyltransferase involved in cell wall biosynthesis
VLNERGALPGVLASLPVGHRPIVVDNGSTDGSGALAKKLGITDRRFGWPLEMVVRATHADWTIREVPVRYSARTGRSKVTGTLLGTLRTIRDMSAVLKE